jgi:uncharacterized protein YacL
MTKRSKWVNRLIIFRVELTHQQKVIRSTITLLLLFVIPIILVFLPESYFDTGNSICLSKVLFNQECYACGLTRACLHLINLNFEKAFEYNMGSFIIFPLLCIFWIYWAFQERNQLAKLLNFNTKLLKY